MAPIRFQPSVATSLNAIGAQRSILELKINLSAEFELWATISMRRNGAGMVSTIRSHFSQCNWSPEIDFGIKNKFISRIRTLGNNFNETKWLRYGFNHP